MESINFLLSSFQVFLIAWARILGLLVVAPVFSSRLIYLRIRIILAFLIALVIVPWFKDYLQNIPGNNLEYMAILLKEFILGAMIGLLLSFIFLAFRISAQFFSVQIGMGIAEAFDAVTQEQSNLWSQFFYFIAVLIFLELNGFHLLINTIVESYQLLPVVELMKNSESFFLKAMEYFVKMFVIALKFSFPIIVASTIIIVTLGIIGKIVPQVNILILGLPIQLGVGIIFIFISLPFIIELFSAFWDNAIFDIKQFLFALRA